MLNLGKSVFAADVGETSDMLLKQVQEGFLDFHVAGVLPPHHQLHPLR